MTASARREDGVGGWVTRRAFLDGDRLALIDGDQRTTYRELDRRTDQIASNLQKSGVQRGDRVAVLMFNSATFVEMLLATAKLGAIFVPINFRLGPDEIAYILSDSGAETFAWSAQLSAVARKALVQETVSVRTRVVVGGEPTAGEYAFAQLAAGDAEAPGVEVPGVEVCALMYTSGTTGKPKGVMLTHDNFLWHVINFLSTGRGLRATDLSVTAAPLFHAGALGVYTLPLLYIGGTNVLLPTFDPAQTLATMARERATVQFLVPAMWAAVMAVPGFESYDLSALEMAITGGAPCPYRCSSTSRAKVCRSRRASA